ncbi:hypothetical protein [Candidatus Entotheonella palauensis]|uniref:hypothetical protein n=1 Tax=Candidatus Entotheonella palauensis TaxID=93172 RepID=UPI000B7D5832
MHLRRKVVNPARPLLPQQLGHRLPPRPPSAAASQLIEQIKLSPTFLRQPEFDEASQRDTLGLALQTLECAPAPRTTVQSPQHWSDDATWKRDFSNIDTLSPEELARLRQAFDEQKEIARAKR